MKIGAMDNVLGKTDDAAFAAAERLKLDGVEVNLKVAELKAAGGDRAAALRRLAERHRVAIPSCVLGEHNGGGLATWWRGTEADEEVRLALDFCQTVGARTLLVPFFFVNEPKGRTHRAAVVERLKPLCAFAADKNVTLAYEGVMPAARLVEIADQISSPAFGVYYDPANATWCDFDVAAEVRTLGPLLRQAHVKDANTFTGDAHAGAGRVDWAAFAAALRDVKYDRWLVLETPGGDPEAVAPDVAFARDLARRIGG